MSSCHEIARSACSLLALFGSEKWNDRISRLNAFVRKRRHLCLTLRCYLAECFTGHNEIVRGTDSLIAGTVIFMKVLRDGICE